MYEYVGAGEFHSGIPARDLSAEDVAALDKDQRALVRRSGLYRKAAPAPKAETPATEEAAS